MGELYTWFLVEHVEGVDYCHFAQFLEAIFKSRTPSQHVGLDKKKVKALLGLACSDREKELIRYSIFKSSGLTASGARRCFGFEGMSVRSKRVEECIRAAQDIRAAIEKLSQIQDKALLTSLGFLESQSSETEDTDSECSSESVPSPSSQNEPISLPSFDTLMAVLKNGQYNWFCVLDFLEESLCSSNVCAGDSIVEAYLNDFYSFALDLATDQGQKALLTSSYAALHASLPDANQDRVASLLNGDIVTDSESDNPDEYVGVTSVVSEKAKNLVAKKRVSLARRMRRLQAKHLATANFLSRRLSKPMKTLVDRFPDIGQSIESFVSDCNVGADSWRRTGVLTFDGNLRINQKPTYGRIQQYLQEKYQYKFSYGTVVQLCVARNKRRRSSSNYKGVAKVTTRRARKGFELRYNPDKHWSGALYRGLNFIQYTDGSNIVNINRDDASGFRLDTLTTHSKHGTPAVQGEDILTTHTDYVSRYPAVLQTTSYNFSPTKTTSEMCAGVVKGSKVYPKNPAQHYADIEMLSNIPDLQSVFLHPSSGQPKQIECVRVDGATDEGPGHDEVRFWWAERHLKHGKLVTMLSSRSSGSSYLNRVELQNGCLALGHTNLFIPSTLDGSAFNPETGAVDMERVRKNLDLATSVYINRVNHCPCGETVIHLYRGADSTDIQDKRRKLLVFLKGTKKKREELCRDEPELFAYFNTVWQMKQRHEIPGLPSQYLYVLICCFQKTCPHPLCQSGRKGVPTWFPNGPTIHTIPLPVPDPAFPWGNKSCSRCTGFCAGHFLQPAEALQARATEMKQPPSLILKDFFHKLAGREPSEDMLETVARDTLLPLEEVRMWLDHLTIVAGNRKRGAAKAAETRRHKRNSQRSTEVADVQCHSAATPEQEEYHCGICGVLFADSDEPELWVGCDTCDTWYHGDCVNINSENEPEKFYCSACTA